MRATQDLQLHAVLKTLFPISLADMTKMYKMIVWRVAIGFVEGASEASSVGRIQASKMVFSHTIWALFQDQIVSVGNLDDTRYTWTQTV